MILTILDISQFTIKIIGDYEDIYSVNPLHLIIGKVDYLVFDSIDQNKEIFKKYTELWDGIKNESETINGGKKGEYGKDFTKIKFNTYDNLPLSKPLKFHMLIIIAGCIFEEDGKFYPQLYLDDYLYEA